MLKGKTILITGASSGIGRAFALRFAREGCDLIVVARREDRLKSLKGEAEAAYGVKVEVIAMDLGNEDSAEKLFGKVEKKRIPVFGLVNNAGFGWNGVFDTQPADNIDTMIAVNVLTLTKLCRLFLPAMLKQNGGLILNVSSMGGFQPVPYFAVYAAAKSYVLNLSAALSAEFRKTKVRIFALCPGVTDTEFQAVAGMPSQGSQPVGAQTAEQVVDFAFRKIKGSAYLGVPGLMNKIMIGFSRITPMKWSAIISSTMFKPGK
ncbi:MAG: SDR family oxidoreductase [Spirochaetes bacterium]|nr:MAG: SDR family oxidoreductase [Spirochaetota bacterium]